MLAALIPVKSLMQTKSRLTAVLSAAERAELTLALLHRTLQLLTAVSGIDGVMVISRDGAVADAAASWGAQVFAESAAAGLNGALHEGRQHARQQGATQLLILPCDLPTLIIDDVDAVLDWRTALASNCTALASNCTALASECTAVICPDQHQQGTNGLFISALRPFCFHFGPGSLHLHLAEMARQQQTAQLIQRPGWQFDLDTAQDWRILTSTAPEMHGLKPPRP
jgi:2-phospho-L-lactate guanylyltransferase